MLDGTSMLGRVRRQVSKKIPHPSTDRRYDSLLTIRFADPHIVTTILAHELRKPSSVADGCSRACVPSLCPWMDWVLVPAKP